MATGSDVVLGQSLKLLRKEGFQGLGNSPMELLSLRGRQSVVDGPPHLFVAEAIAGVRLDQESQVKQVIRHRQVEVGIDHAGRGVTRGTDACQQAKIHLGADSGSGSQDLLGGK